MIGERRRKGKRSGEEMIKKHWKRVKENDGDEKWTR